MKFRVRTLSRAQRDVDSIVRWLSEAQQSPEGASAWSLAYERALDRLERSPRGCGPAPENAFVDIEVRQCLFSTRRGRTYRAVFTIMEDEIRILRVRGPGQALLTEDELQT